MFIGHCHTLLRPDEHKAAPKFQQKLLYVADKRLKIPEFLISGAIRIPECQHLIIFRAYLFLIKKDSYINVLVNDKDDPHYSAVIANNILKCYVDVMIQSGNS